MSKPAMISTRKTSIFCFGLVGIFGAWGYASHYRKTQFDGTENYTIHFAPDIKGWVKLPKTPDSLFAFEDPKTSFMIRGSSSQVISEVNPTPDLTTDGIAAFYIERTRENMPDWTAKRNDDLPGKNVRFSVIQRQQRNHTVITAFAVEGNTTLMVSISAKSQDPKIVSLENAALGDYVKTIALKKTDMGGGLTAAREAEKDASMAIN